MMSCGVDCHGKPRTRIVVAMSITDIEEQNDFGAIVVEKSLNSPTPGEALKGIISPFISFPSSLKSFVYSRNFDSRRCPSRPLLPI